MLRCCDAESNAGNCLPRLFVYELEDAWRDLTAAENQGDVHPAPMYTIQSGSGSRALIFNADQFDLGTVIFQRALSYQCRTHDALEADLFFIPAYSARFMASNFTTNPSTTLEAALASVTVQEARWRRVRSTRQRVRVQIRVSAVARHRGRDHFLVQPRNGDMYEQKPFRELDYRARVLRGMTKLSVESPRRQAASYSGYYAGAPATSGASDSEHGRVSARACNHLHKHQTHIYAHSSCC